MRVRRWWLMLGCPAVLPAAGQVLAAAALTMTSGCVMIYAPRPQSLGLQNHSQVASNMVINQTIPVEPRLANEIAGVVGAQLKNNSVLSPSGNSVLSPSGNSAFGKPIAPSAGKGGSK